MTDSIDITHLTAMEIAHKLESQELTSRQVTQAYLDRIDAVEPQINAFIDVNSAQALAVADVVDAARAEGKKLHRLAGVPIAIKDLIVTTDQPTTAGSKILEGWQSPYDATVIEKIKQAQMPILGKTNLDEFAMGSSTEHSAYGVTVNPWDLSVAPGGSGGGSAAAVAAREAPLALGTDTGGSIRQPAAYTGTVGLKPTYGAVSRYGAIAMASSLDQIGPAAQNIVDAAVVQELISGYDPKDSTSLTTTFDSLVDAAQAGDVTGMKIGVIKELQGDGYQEDVKTAFDTTVKLLETAGAQVQEVSLPHVDVALGAYYLIMPSEASSNLARFDGMRYGLRVTPSEDSTVDQVMSASRAAGFGDEVKRRILLGTYALSAGSYDAYYAAAQKIRTLIQQDFDEAFKQVDVLVSPTAPTTAFKLGEKIDDPMAMYLNDVATIPANLAGIPGLSIPNGLSAEGLPSGFQILAPACEDHKVFSVGAAAERELEKKWGGAFLKKVPDRAREG